MPELGLQLVTRRERQGGRAVPQVMEPRRRQIGLANQRPESVRDVARALRPPLTMREGPISSRASRRSSAVVPRSSATVRQLASVLGRQTPLPSRSMSCRATDTVRLARSTSHPSQAARLKRAQESATQASEFARQAHGSALEAEESARQAASSAATATRAARTAAAAADSASRSAIRAQSSANSVASSANAALKAKRAAYDSAIAAGKDEAAARTAADQLLAMLSRSTMTSAHASPSRTPTGAA